MVMRLGEMLIKKKLITAQQLESALKEQQESGELIGKVLVSRGYLKEEELLVSLSEQLDIPFVRLQDVVIDPKAIKKVPAKFVWHYKMVPIELVDGKLTVATSEPLRSLDDAKMFLEYELVPVLAIEDEIIKAIEKYYGVGAATIEEIIAKSPQKVDEAGSDRKVEDIEKSAENASVVKLVNQILLEAYQKRATDIHIEPFRDKMGLRYRIDGVLYEANIPGDMVHLFSSIISRIKIMSKLNIVERRLPQDGRAVVKIGQEELDLRISIIPTRYGEGAVIRILPAKMLFSLEKLGLESEELKVLENLINKPHGVIFVTGPTGSGKTTTLYTCLNKIKSSKNKIITIEDPIEYELEGISQIQVMPEIGLSFAQGLRSVLRHDPDVMMVGEVRDFETAELAVRIALTGHLLFSTIHTNDAAGGVTRLVDIGVEPFLVSSSVRAFIAQRLVRVICSHCKEKDKDANEGIKKQIIEEVAQFCQLRKSSLSSQSEFLNLKNFDINFFKAKGCKICNFTGYKDRVAIYEILVINRKIRELILAKASTSEIREEAIKQGMQTLRFSGWKKVIQGVTTPDEVMRVTQMEE